MIPDPTVLPSLMVAPNGARRTKADHPALPITIEETVAAAVACAAAGADGIHLHVRDDTGGHSLDAARYTEAITRISEAAPDLFIQITSEAAGRYEAKEQRALIRTLKPSSVSLALREMIRTPDDSPEAHRLYHWAEDAGVCIQHIVYTPDELVWLLREIDSGTIPGHAHQLQIVLGAYGNNQPPAPGTLDAYLAPITERQADLQFDWMACAFGPSETACLKDAVARGGKARVGFENSFWNADGTVARDNAERVREVAAALKTVEGGASDLIAS